MNFFILFVAMSVVCLTTSIQSVVGCPDGTELKGEICTPCSDGMFRNGDMSKCKTFQTCDNYPLVIDFRGNSTHDAVCRCDDPKFPIVYGNICVRDTNCPAGTYLSGGKSNSCVDCLNGTFKNKTGPDECLICTKCSKILRECNSTHDAVCEHTIEAYKNSSTNGDPSTGASSLNTGTIIAVVLVLAAVVIAFVVAGVCWCRKHRRFKFSSGSSEDSPSSPAAKPLMSPQNGDQNKSNAFANSLDTSTNHQSHLFSICCLPHHNADAGSSQRPNKSQQHKNSNLEDDSKPNETPGQPMVGLNSEVDPQVVANPAMASASLQHTDNREPQQNGNPNDNLPASGIRDREDPVNQNENTSLRPNDSQQNKNNSPTDDSKPQISEAPTTSSLEQPSGRDIVDQRENRLLPSRPRTIAQPQTNEVPEDSLWDYEGCITKKYNSIRKHVIFSDFFLGRLLERGILTHEQMTEIKHIEKNKSKGDAIDQLIKLMRLHGNDGFECFIEALVGPDVRLDGLAKLIHRELAERYIKERDSEDTKDQDSKTEPPPRKASSEGKDEVDFGKSGADETKIKAVGSDETQTKILGSDETIIKAIDSDETEMKAND